MAFEFKQKQSVGKAVRRLGSQRVEKALRDLEHGERLESVHEVRKTIKQMRALLRLVRPALARRDYRRCSAPLRQAARLLGPARDVHVTLNALEDLTGRFKAELAPSPFPELKRALDRACRKEQSALARHRAPVSVGRLLKQTAREFASLKLKTSGWSALAPGLKRSYGAGRRSYRLARQASAPEPFHEWRKRVKDLYYQLGLLCPIWPEQLCAAETELERLGEYLGDDHDLFLLSEAARSKRLWQHAPHEPEALQALAQERQRALRARALAQGTRFYEEKPVLFCKRLEGYWKRWRHEPKRVTRAL